MIVGIIVISDNIVCSNILRTAVPIVLNGKTAEARAFKVTVYNEFFPLLLGKSPTTGK